MGETSLFGNICAVVVTYNIGNQFESCFKSIKGQVDHIVLVNTSTDDGITARMLGDLRQKNTRLVDVIECPENNLGMAQNMGIARALDKGADWVLLLDHDSRLKAGMIPAMETALRRVKDQRSIGIIAPYLKDPELDAPPKYLKAWYKYWFQQVSFDEKTHFLHDLLCVSASGCLIPARLLRDEELRMDESFVIDGIDTDFCLRVQQYGFRIMAVRDAVLEHKIGARRRHNLLGLNIITTHHAPMRRYYLYRNRLKIWKRHALAMPGFFFFDFLRVVYEFWRILLLEDNKQAKLEHIFAGFLDGLRGIKGAKPGEDNTRTPEDKGAPLPGTAKSAKKKVGV